MPSATATRVFRLAVGVVALHVLDDNFVQPQPGTVGRRSPRQRPRAARRARARGLGVPAPPRRPPRGAGAGRSACSGSSPASRPCATRSRSAPSGDDYTGLLSIPAGLALLGLGAATLWRTRRRDDGHARRYLRRSLLGAAGAVVALLVVAPLSGSYLYSHLGRAVVPAAEPGRRLRAGDVHHERRPRALRLVRAVQEPRRRDRVPGPQRPAGADADARPARLRRAAVRPPRLGRERGRPARVRLGGREGHQGRDRVPEAPAGRRPRSGSAASGCPSEAS